MIISGALIDLNNCRINFKQLVIAISKHGNQSLWEVFGFVIATSLTSSPESRSAGSFGVCDALPVHNDSSAVMTTVFSLR